MGLAIGVTVMALIMSPWGRKSGGHINPAMTFAFYRLEKLRPWDALFYGVAQFSGATVGVALATFLLRGAPGHDTVRYAVTAPGVYGAAVAFAAELAISFILMITVLLVTNHERLARYTPYFVGSLYAVYIAFETPLSGMSMNPARTFGPAAYGGYWHALWIYFIAPTVGMLAAAETFLRIRRGVAPYCAKLHHANHERCIFHHTPEVPKRFTQSARGQESGPVQPPPARMVEESQRSAGGSSEFDVGKKARAQNWQELRRLLNVSN
jgi:aquaporin Z